MSNTAQPQSTWPRFHFGLLVTGRTEEDHAPKLFWRLEATGTCHFDVIRRVSQFQPRTSQKHYKITGTDIPLPTKAVETISLPTRGYLRRSDYHFVVLLDDLEYDRRDKVRQIYELYRQALDTVLTGDQWRRASMHFLVYMVEAYYFGDPDALNSALGLNPPLASCQGDVEAIRHPKRELERLHPGFREIDDGGEILARLNVERVLADPTTCAWLRTLFGWCVKILEKHPHWQAVNPGDVFHLADGIMSCVTGPQIGDL